MSILPFMWPFVQHYTTTCQAVIAFVIVSNGIEDSAETAEELRQHVGKDIGPIAKPKKVHIVTDLPKTRSGKIMRRLLKDVAENREIGNTMTLADASVMESIEKSVAEV